MPSLKTKYLPLLVMFFSLLLISGPGTANSCNHENVAIPWSTPSSDFTQYNDGTVTHNTTGLMWMRCSLGQSWDGNSCQGSVSDFSWKDALAKVAVLNEMAFAGKNDWRLPNKNELASIVEERCQSPSINNSVFPNTFGSGYWTSSSASAESSYRAWLVDFRSGNVGHYNKNNLHPVRLVRAGQSSGPDDGNGPAPRPGSITSVKLSEL